MKSLQVFPPVLRTSVPWESHFPSSRAQGGLSAADTPVVERPEWVPQKTQSFPGGLRAYRSAEGGTTGHTRSRSSHSRTLAHAPRTLAPRGVASRGSRPPGPAGCADPAGWPRAWRMEGWAAGGPVSARRGVTGAPLEKRGGGGARGGRM